MWPVHRTWGNAVSVRSAGDSVALAVVFQRLLEGAGVQEGFGVLGAFWGLREFWTGQESLERST